MIYVQSGSMWVLPVFRITDIFILGKEPQPHTLYQAKKSTDALQKKQKNTDPIPGKEPHNYAILGKEPQTLYQVKNNRPYT
jgi:hypothetical protein